MSSCSPITAKRLINGKVRPVAVRRMPKTVKKYTVSEITFLMDMRKKGYSNKEVAVVMRRPVASIAVQVAKYEKAQKEDVQTIKDDEDEEDKKQADGKEKKEAKQ